MVRKLGFKKDRPYYCEKALCIVSEYCYPDQYCELLQQIYRIGMSKNDVPFYKVVQNLVDDMEMIDPEEWGKVALRYTYGGCKIILETRARFPVVSVNLLIISRISQSTVSSNSYKSIRSSVYLNQCCSKRKYYLFLSQKQSLG